MTDLTEQYQEDLADRDLPSDIASVDKREVIFEPTRTQEEITAHANNNNKFSRVDPEEKSSDPVKDAMARTAVNAGSYILSVFSDTPQSEIRSSAMESLDLDEAPKDDYLGMTVEVGASLAGGMSGIKLLNKIHDVGRTYNLLKGSTLIQQKAVAGLAGESLALNAVAPNAGAAYSDVAKALNVSESMVSPLFDLAIYAFSHNMDDPKAVKFIKTFVGDTLLAKNLDKVLTSFKSVYSGIVDYAKRQDAASEIVADMKKTVSDGDVSDMSKAEKLTEMLSVDLPTEPMGEEILEQLKESLVQSGKRKQMFQIEAAKKFTKGSEFVNPDGMPMIYTHNGNIKGRPSPYFQDTSREFAISTSGFHLSKFVGEIEKMERPGKFNNFVISVPSERVLHLEHLKNSDEAVNKTDVLMSVVADNPRFDINTVVGISQKADAMTDQQLLDIVAHEGLDPKGYSIETIREQYKMERILDSGGYEAVLYKNDVQGGVSATLMNPDSAISSVYSQRTSRAENTLSVHDVDSPTGHTMLSDSKSRLTEELMRITKQQEQEFGIEFSPANRPVGIDFNFDRILSNEGVENIIDDVSQAYKSVIDKSKRESITHDLTHKMAKELDWNVDNILKRQKGGTFNAEQMLAARQIMIASASVLDNLAGKINKKLATDADKTAFENQMKLHVLIQAQVKGAQTEIARALSAMRISAGSNFEGVEKVLDHKNIEDMADKYSKLQTNAQRNKFAKQAAGQKWDTYLYVMTNSLLSNPLTQVKNFASNAAVQLYAIPEALVEQSIATTRRAMTGSNEGARFTDGLAAISALPQAFKNGLSLGSNAWKTGIPSDRFTKSQYSLNNTISSQRFDLDEHSMLGRGIDLLGSIIGMPGRSLLTQDEVFKGFTYEINKSVLANQRLATDVLDGQLDSVAITNRHFDATNGYDVNINASAADKAHELTFTQDLEGFLKEVQGMRHKFPLVQVTIPFFRAPMNIIGSALSRTPLAGLSSKIRDDLLSGGPRADKAMAKISLGTGIMTVAYNEAINGRITGGGSGQISLDKHMESVGRKPYSFVMQKGELSEDTLNKLQEAGIEPEFRDNSVYIPYKSFEPIGTVLALAADVSDFMKFYHGKHDESTEQIAAMASIHAVTKVSNNTFMNSVFDFARMTQDPDGYFSKWAAGVITQSIPGGALLGGIERIKDTEQRVSDQPRGTTPIEQQVYDMIARVQSRLPGVSEKLPLGLNVWGSPIKYGDGNWTELFNPAHRTKGKRQAIDVEIERIGNVIEMPSDKVQGVRLSGKEYNDLVKTMNSIEVDDEVTGLQGNYRQVLNGLVGMQEYKMLTRDDQISLIDNIKGKFLKAARMIIIDRYDSLQEDIIELKEAQLNERLDAREGIL